MAQKEWIGVYRDPVVLLILVLYGHPGLWQHHCEKGLYAVGFHPLYPECWPSMFWHPRLKLLLGVYVGDFKMSGPAKNVEEGWKFIASQIDMDTPEDAGRYFGCEHAFKQMTRFAHGKPARSRPERHVVLRFVLELLAMLQVVMNTYSKFRHVLPVVPRSAGQPGWLT